MSAITTNTTEAEIYKSLPAFAVDIETDTENPDKSWKNSYGLSFVSDITFVSLYAGRSHPTVVLDMTVYETREKNIQFLREVFNRVGYTAIAHNATFDMRSLGGQYNIRVPLGSYVWDTQTMSLLLMMGENFKEDTSLLSLSTRYGLFETAEEFSFADQMKGVRGDLHTVLKDQVERYVALDSILAWRLYSLQKEIIAQSPNVKNDVNYVFGVGAGWEGVEVVEETSQPVTKIHHTKRWSALPELVDWETRISRWCCNQAARGVRVDIDGIYTHLDQLTKSTHDAMDVVMEQFQGHFNDVSWSLLSFFSFIYELYKSSGGSKEITGGRAAKLLEKLKTFPYFFFSPDSLDGRMEAILQLFPSNEVALVSDFFQLYRTEGFDDIGVLNLPAFSEPPTSWVETYVRSLYEMDADSPSKRYRINITVKFILTYILSKEEIPPVKLIRKKLFKPFFLFCVLKKDVPGNADMVRDVELVTKKLQGRLTQKTDDDYQQLAIEDDLFSISKKAMEFYYPKDSTGKREVTAFEEVLMDTSKTGRIDEFLRHSSRDGRLHTIIARKARTGRGTSSSMNLQNLDLDEFRGYLIADSDDRTLGGVDLSNAENWMLALVFADSALARACSSGDFHSEMTRIYWPEYSKKLLDSGDVEEFHKLRKSSKFVTFGSAYGAQAPRIARMIGTSELEAERLLMNRDARFPTYASGRDKVKRLAEKCARDGNVPPYTVLWTGRRIPIGTDIFVYEDPKTKKKVRHMKLATRKVVNYLPQGGVGEIIWRAIVLLSEEFERDGIDAYISLQIHDEIVFDAPNEIFLDVAKRVSEVLYEIVPKQFLTRTVPEIRFISELGPENKDKWGYRIGREYPIDQTKFVNPWGIFDMPEGEKKAPTWVGPLHEGYTVEREMKEKLGENYVELEVADIDDVEDTVEEQSRHVDNVRMVSSRWKQYLSAIGKLKVLISEFEDRAVPATLYIGGESKGAFSFQDRMAILEDLTCKGGTDEEYETLLELVETINELSEKAIHLSRGGV